jgi:hypothetical protein
MYLLGVIMDSRLLATIYSSVMQNLTQHIHCTSCTFKNHSQLNMYSRNNQSLKHSICNEKPPIKQGAVDRSFLLDTVRHISRNKNYKKIRVQLVGLATIL